MLFDPIFNSSLKKAFPSTKSLVSTAKLAGKSVTKEVSVTGVPKPQPIPSAVSAAPIAVEKTPRRQFKHDYSLACVQKLKEAKDLKLVKDPAHSKTLTFAEFVKIKPEKFDDQYVFSLKMKVFSEKMEAPFTYEKGMTDDLRNELVKLSKDPFYQANKGTDHPAVNYLQLCAIKLESVDGKSLAIDYSESAMDRTEISGQNSCGDFAHVVDKAREKKADGLTTCRDSKIATTFWAVAHPKRTLHTRTADKDPIEYQSYKGNSVFQGPVFEGRDGERLNHKHCPGLTGANSLVKEVLIPGYEKLGLRWVHINNQDGAGGHDSEFKRVQEVDKWAAENPATFSHALISFDVPSKTGKSIINKFVEGNCSREVFYGEYEFHIREGIRGGEKAHGIVIPSSVLSDVELEAAFTASKNMILKSYEPNKAEFSGSPQARKRLVHAIDRNIAQVLEWAIMKKELAKGAINEQTDPDLKYSTFSMACKENIDRGPQENMGVVINDKLLEEVEFTKEEVQIYGGIMLARPDFSMDRAFQKKRFDPFKDRVEYICKNEKTRRIAFEELASLHLVISPPKKAPVQLAGEDDPSYLTRMAVAMGWI